MLTRLTRMGPESVALARALAVLGSHHEVAVVAELAGLDVIAAELLADALAAAQILAPARPLDFFHPLIREAVYADIALGTRRLMHRSAAALLDRTGVRSAGGGHGIIGMRERATMLGGTLDAGPAEDGGFRVTAVLPVSPPEEAA
jgi:hypothetical protein